jgi:hypothetical protein
MGFKNFVPPKPPEVPPYATYVPDRSPQFKVHASRGKAVSAISYVHSYQARGGIVYALVDGKWKEELRYEPQETCDKCNKKFSWQNYPVALDRSLPVLKRRYVHRNCREQ